MSVTTGNAPESRQGADWAAWQRSWDRQQEWYLPDREERFRVMLDMVEATAGSEPRVLDLACGTGCITDRLLRRFPGAASTGVDLDPALLAIARGYFADRPEASFVTADLKDPHWTAALPHRGYDAVLTATALHWLHAEELRVLYGQLADVLRPGGVLINADHMPDPDTPLINAAESARRHARMEREKEQGVLSWSEWWQLAAQEPALAGPAAERFRIYGAHGDGETPSARWHADALRAAGFREARPIWASPSDAMVMGLR